MSDEDKLEMQLTRGASAERELAALDEAFKAVRSRYVDAWMASDARDTTGREKLWVATTIVSLVEAQLRQFVADGKIAAATLDQIRKAGEPPKKLLGLI